MPRPRDAVGGGGSSVRRAGCGGRRVRDRSRCWRVGRSAAPRPAVRTAAWAALMVWEVCWMRTTSVSSWDSSGGGLGLDTADDWRKCKLDSFC